MIQNIAYFPFNFRTLHVDRPRALDRNIAALWDEKASWKLGRETEGGRGRRRKEGPAESNSFWKELKDKSVI